MKCSEKDCKKRAICSRRTKTGIRPVCVEHWEQAYRLAHPIDGRVSNPKQHVSHNSSGLRSKRSKQGGSISDAVYAYFDMVGIENATCEKTRDIALGVKVDSKFNNGHFCWYKNTYRKMKGL